VIRDGRPESGITAHLMTEQFDAAESGPGRVPARTRGDLLTVSMKLANAAVPLMSTLLERYRRGERPAGDPQDEALRVTRRSSKSSICASTGRSLLRRSSA